MVVQPLHSASADLAGMFIAKGEEDHPDGASDDTPRLQSMPPRCDVPRGEPQHEIVIVVHDKVHDFAQDVVRHQCHINQLM